VIRTLLLATIGALGCLTHWCGPARASTTTEAALAVACPGHADLAKHVDRAARTHLLHPVTLVALISNESHCDTMAVNHRSGALGLGQILPGRSADLPGRYLLDPADNLYLTARHLSGLLLLCGSLAGAVHVYHGHRKCSGWRRDWYAKRVAGDVERIWREMRRQREGRS